MIETGTSLLQAVLALRRLWLSLRRSATKTPGASNDFLRRTGCMKMSKTVLASVLVLITTSALAAELTPAGQQAFDSLRGVSTFRFGNGRAGGRSPNEKSVMVLLKERDSQQVFQKLLHEGSLPAQLYVLTVQRAFDTNRFGQNLKGYLHMTNQVATMEGCIVYSKTIGQIAEGIRQGRYDWVWQQK